MILSLNFAEFGHLLNSLLTAWSDNLSHNSHVISRMDALRKNISTVFSLLSDSQKHVRLLTGKFRSELLSARDHSEEHLIIFSETTRLHHDAFRKYLEAVHQIQLTNELSKARADAEELRHEAVEAEKKINQQLQATLSSLEEVQCKDQKC